MIVHGMDVFPRGARFVVETFDANGTLAPATVEMPHLKRPSRCTVVARCADRLVEAQPRSGHGGPDYWYGLFWLPWLPPGRFALHLAWGKDDRGGTVEVDGDRLAEAARGCAPLWPDNGA
jgi:hypothetical protein